PATTFGSVISILQLYHLTRSSREPKPRAVQAALERGRGQSKQRTRLRTAQPLDVAREQHLTVCFLEASKRLVQQVSLFNDSREGLRTFGVAPARLGPQRLERLELTGLPYPQSAHAQQAP